MAGVLAIDLGATSGRAILSEIKHNRLEIREIKRFENNPIKQRGYLCWDIDYLLEQVLDSIALASSETDVLSVGIDTWGVDYGLLDSDGQLISLPVHYREPRTKGILEKVVSYSSLSDLYFKTGNQLMEINTLFQLLVQKMTSPTSYFKGQTLLMIPDLLNYYLTGFKGIERSIASTTQMLDVKTAKWRNDILELFEINPQLLPDIVSEGQVIGHVKNDHQKSSVQVVTVLSHDTASAIASLPIDNQSALFISSGTWSLIGTLLDKPIVNEVSLSHQFTNELGEAGQVTFLKNCTGLWIVEELRREYASLNQPYTYGDIGDMVQEEVDCVLFDTDSPEFAEARQLVAKSFPLTFYQSKSTKKKASVGYDKLS